MESNEHKSNRQKYMKALRSDSFPQKQKLKLKDQSLRIVVISDYHLNKQMLQKFNEQIVADQLHFDYCLVPGDIANCNYHNHTHNEEEMLQQTNEALSKLHDILQCKILFIPGNHDNNFYLDGKQHPNPSIINIHKRQYYLQAGLKICGLGGSLPAYRDQEGKNKVWEGHPYNNEEQYNKDLKILTNQKQEDVSKIYMIHIGPGISNTTVVREKGSSVYSGCNSLNRLLDEEKLVFFLHGHTHQGSRFERYNGKIIVNPGALQRGDYAKIELAGENKKWKVKSICFENLQ